MRCGRWRDGDGKASMAQKGGERRAGEEEGRRGIGLVGPGKGREGVGLRPVY